MSPKPLTPEEVEYLKVYQPTRAMMLGLLPWPPSRQECGCPRGIDCAHD